MKSRQKFTVPGKSISKRFDSDTDGSLENRVKKKIGSNPLIQKNINFLQTYNCAFRKPFTHFGDADTYFKKSLRSYEALDLIRDLNLGRHLVKSAKSFDTLYKRKPRSKQTLLSPRLPNRHSLANLNCASVAAQKEELLVKELFSSQFKERSQSEESETEDVTEEQSTTHVLGDLKEVEEVSDEDSTPKVQLNLSKRLDDILESEKGISEVESVKMEEDEAEEMDQQALDEALGAEGVEGEVMGDEDRGGEVMGDEDVGRELMGDEGEGGEVMGGEGVGYEALGEEAGEGEGEAEDIAQIGEMIQRASAELEGIVEENQQLMMSMEPIEEKPEEEGKGDDAQGSFFKFNPEVDAAILCELEDAERQAKETAKIINELKTRVGELLQKEQMTDAEARELEEKNKQLKAQMILFEEKTKRIQQLIAQSNLFESMTPVSPLLQKKNKEDMLPKVVVCGLAQDNVPTFIVCDERKKNKCQPRTPKTPRPLPGPPLSTPVSPQLAQKLSECYCMQEKLAAENADLEGKRYKLQSDLINKDQTVECLQRQLANLQNQMQMVYKENALLHQKMQGGMTGPTCTPSSRCSSPSRSQKAPCGRNRGICPADLEARLDLYCENTQNLEKLLGDMEGEVKNMQEELLAVQKEREHLEHHRKMMCMAPPCLPVPPCYPPPPCGPYPCMPPTTASSPCECGKGSPEQQLRELREQYNRLQDDFKSKLTEVAGLRTDNEKLKETTQKAVEAKASLEAKLKELEAELKKFRGVRKSNEKEQLIEMEQQLIVAKQRFREAQDELEELRALVEDQQSQLDDYRNKYLEAQQQVEEQRRSIDMMEMENQRISEQVNLEIQRVKNQFQEKLTELMPLPDILKSTQLKLQEAQQMHLLAERNNEAIARELQQYKDKFAVLEEEMAGLTGDQAESGGEMLKIKDKVADLEALIEELKKEKEQMETDMEELQAKCDDAERLAEERIHEVTQLESQLNDLREETARQVARTKDRCEIVRKSMQNQIGDLERQLAQSRALAKTAQRDRDEIRQKMQAQINNLNENFEDAQMRIRNLQGHVNFLKTTYGNTFSTEAPPKETRDPCNCSAEY